MVTLVTQDLTVPAGEVRTYVMNPDYYIMGALHIGWYNATVGEVYYEPTILNYGEMHLDAAGYGGGAFFQFAGSLHWDYGTLKNYGLISAVVPTVTSVRALFAPTSSPTVYNYGTIRAEALDDATGYENWDNSLFVNGPAATIRAQAAERAVALYFPNGGWITNDGQILAHVTGGGIPYIPDSASAIKVGYGSFVGLSLVNTGLIQATGTNPAHLVEAITLRTEGPFSLVNSGTIRGTYAIAQYSSGNPPPNYPVSIENRGLIEGRILLVAGNDTITNFSQMVGNVDLGAGNDVYDGAAGTVTGQVRGGAGNDRLTGGAGDETLFGDDGDDRLDGGGGNDILSAGLGNDTLIGGGGNDVFLFGAAMTSADVMDGGAGIDQFALQGDYAGGNALTLGSGVVGFESIAILPGNDTRFGDPGTNFYDYVVTTLDANVAAGVQVIVDANRLRAGEDFTFDGSAESDGGFFIWGGGGVDTLTGGAMTDIFYFGENGQFGAGDVVNGGGGTDQLGLRGNYTITFGAGQLVGIENIGMVSAQDTRFGALGSTFSYNLTMHDGNVAAGVQLTVDSAALRGGETLTFNGAAETDGSFRVFGGAGNDTIAAGAGNDILIGRGGADLLTGGGGADTFRYDATSDSTGAASDQILDFTPGTDTIDLSRIDADSHAAGDQAFAWIGANAFSGQGAASAGELRAYQSGGNWFVEGDTDGNGSADLVIALTLQGPTPLGAGDIVL